MVKPISETQGFIELSPSILQQEPFPEETKSVVAEPVELDQPPIQQAPVATKKVAVEESAPGVESVETQSKADTASNLTPEQSSFSFSLPDFGSILSSIMGEDEVDPEPMMEQADIDFVQERRRLETQGDIEIEPETVSYQPVLQKIKESPLRGSIDTKTPNNTRVEGLRVREVSPDNKKAGSGFTGFESVGRRAVADIQKELGLTREQALGIIGNFSGETGGFTLKQELNPVVKGSRGGLGWAQWTGPRRRQFEAWSKKQGLETDSYEANLGFFLQEARTTEASAIKALRRAKTVEEATVIFQEKFERPGIPHTKGRLEWARKASLWS